MKKKKKILFVCIGNTCRSQMAEGFAVRHGAVSVEVRSAGTSAMGMVNGSTINAMHESGIDISAQSSTQLTPEDILWADVVVTLGCVSAAHLCPPSYAGEKLDWDIPDPLGRPWGFMQRVRDDIEKRVKELLVSVEQ